MPPTDLLDVKSAAEHLGVTAGTLRAWVRDGRLAAVRYHSGGRIYFRPEDVEALRVPRVVEAEAS